MSNTHNTVYYIGIMNSLERRNIEHKFKQNKISFTAKYNISKLLYFEEYYNSQDAICCEKQLKKRRRDKKLNLVKKMNPEMKDLFTFSGDLSASSG
jgi:putative endonuclease